MRPTSNDGCQLERKLIHFPPLCRRVAETTPYPIFIDPAFLSLQFHIVLIDLTLKNWECILMLVISLWNLASDQTMQLPLAICSAVKIKVNWVHCVVQDADRSYICVTHLHVIWSSVMYIICHRHHHWGISFFPSTVHIPPTTQL